MNNRDTAIVCFSGVCTAGFNIQNIIDFLLVLKDTATNSKRYACEEQLEKGVESL